MADAMTNCRVCGREITVAGLGGHIRIHKPTKKQAELLAMITATPGLHPRAYATRIGWTRESVSGVARGLRRLGRVRVVGNRAGARYFPAHEPEGTVAPPATPGRSLTCEVCGRVFPGPRSLGSHRGQAHRGRTPEKAIAAVVPSITANGTNVVRLAELLGARVRTATLIGDNMLVLDGALFEIVMEPVT